MLSPNSIFLEKEVLGKSMQLLKCQPICEPSPYYGPNNSTAETPDGGRGNWDRTSVRSILKLKKALLSSAARHNKIPGMDNNGFAALLAAILRNERRIGDYTSFPDRHSKPFQIAENLFAWAGCTTSGHEIFNAVGRGDFSNAFRYLKREAPLEDGVRWATVGIGNVGLNTAADLWLGQWEIEPLRSINASGEEYDIPNPFTTPQTGCTAMFGGVCVSYQPSEGESYQILAQQLLDRESNVEYVAGNLEYGALRAMSKGLTPSAFNSATWHMQGVQTNKEIDTLGWNPGGAIWVLGQIPTALEILGLTSTWNLSMEPQYVYYSWQQSR